MKDILKGIRRVTGSEKRRRIEQVDQMRLRSSNLGHRATQPVLGPDVYVEFTQVGLSTETGRVSIDFRREQGTITLRDRTAEEVVEVDIPPYPHDVLLGRIYSADQYPHQVLQRLRGQKAIARGSEIIDTFEAEVLKREQMRD